MVSCAIVPTPFSPWTTIAEKTNVQSVRYFSPCFSMQDIPFHPQKRQRMRRQFKGNFFHPCAKLGEDHDPSSADSVARVWTPSVRDHLTRSVPRSNNNLAQELGKGPYKEIWHVIWYICLQGCRYAFLIQPAVWSSQ